jgi:hypothetical protein
MLGLTQAVLAAKSGHLEDGSYCYRNRDKGPEGVDAVLNSARPRGRRRDIQRQWGRRGRLSEAGRDALAIAILNMGATLNARWKCGGLAETSAVEGNKTAPAPREGVPQQSLVTAATPTCNARC